MRRRLRLLFVFTFSGLAAVLGFNYLMNPFGIWPLEVVDQEYTKAGRGLVFPGHSVHIREEATVALIGSSRTRTGFWVPSVCRDGILNTGIPNASLPNFELVAQQLGERDDVELVIVEASFFMVLAAFEDQDLPDLVERLQGNTRRQITETLASRGALHASYRKLRRSLGAYKDDARPIPWDVPDVVDLVGRWGEAPGMSEDVVRRSIQQSGSSLAIPEVVPERVERLQQIALDLQSRGKQVLFFVPPVTEYRLEVIRQRGLWEAYGEWKADLVSVAPMWDFGRSGALSVFDAGFRDTHHFKDGIGWLLMRRILRLGEEGLDELSLSLLDAGRHYEAGEVDKVGGDAATRQPDVDTVYRELVSEVLPRT